MTDKLINYLDKTIEWCVYILLIVIPLSKSLIEVVFTIALVAWLTKKILKKDYKLKATPLNLALLGFFAANALSIVNSDAFFKSSRALFSKTSEHILLFFIIVETINNKEKIKNVLTIALFSVIIVTTDAYFQHYVWHHDLFRLYPSFKYAPLTNPNWGQFLGFPTGPFPFPNDLSAWMLIFILPLLSIFIWGLKRYKKMILTVVLLPFMYLFYLANTRSAWFGFLTCFFIILFLKSKKILLIVVIFLLVAVPFLPKDKIENITDLSSIKDRFGLLWQAGVKVFMEHPIIGNGLNTSFNKFMLYRNDECKGLAGSYVHNGYLQIACDVGIIGLGFFLMIIIKLFTSTCNILKNEKEGFYNALRTGLLFGILAFLVHSFFDTNLQSFPLVMLFWYAMGALVSLNNLEVHQKWGKT